MKQLDRKDELLEWLRCPRCGGKTRIQIRAHTVLEDFTLFCPKCKYTFQEWKNGRKQNARRLDAVQSEKIGLCCVYCFMLLNKKARRKTK